MSEGHEPAFPAENLGQYSYSGMSKRFYAACAAMQGLLSNSNPVVRSYTSEQLIEISYKKADELIKQENAE